MQNLAPAFYAYFTLEEWDAMRSTMATDAHQPIVFQRLIGLGARCLGEPTFKAVASLLLLLQMRCNKDMACHLPWEAKKAFLDAVKLAFKRRIRALKAPVEYLTELPADPAFMKAKHASLYAAAFPCGGDPAVCPLSLIDLIAIDASYGCRGSMKSASSVVTQIASPGSSTGGFGEGAIVNMFGQMMALQQQSMAVLGAHGNNQPRALANMALLAAERSPPPSPSNLGSPLADRSPPPSPLTLPLADRSPPPSSSSQLLEDSLPPPESPRSQTALGAQNLMLEDAATAAPAVDLAVGHASAVRAPAGAVAVGVAMLEDAAAAAPAVDLAVGHASAVRAPAGAVAVGVVQDRCPPAQPFQADMTVRGLLGDFLDMEKRKRKGTAAVAAAAATASAAATPAETLGEAAPPQAKVAATPAAATAAATASAAAAPAPPPAVAAPAAATAAAPAAATASASAAPAPPPAVAVPTAATAAAAAAHMHLSAAAARKRYIKKSAPRPEADVESAAPAVIAVVEEPAALAVAAGPAVAAKPTVAMEPAVAEPLLKRARTHIVEEVGRRSKEAMAASAKKVKPAMQHERTRRQFLVRGGSLNIKSVSFKYSDVADMPNVESRARAHLADLIVAFERLP